MNGLADIIVPRSAGEATKTAMTQVFTNYQLKNMIGTHLTTTTNPLNMPKLYCWLKENVPGIDFSILSPLRVTPCFLGK